MYSFLFADSHTRLTASALSIPFRKEKSSLKILMLYDVTFPILAFLLFYSLLYVNSSFTIVIVFLFVAEWRQQNALRTTLPFF